MKVISGGQTGIDKLGLFIAKTCGIETGGTAPKGYKTEEGPDLELRDIYGLKEHESALYPPRTKCNIQDSDCTLIFGNESETGTKLTIKLCKELRKPYLLNPKVIEIISLRDRLRPNVINIAGNRKSKLKVEDALNAATVLREGLTFKLADNSLLF